MAVALLGLLALQPVAAARRKAPPLLHLRAGRWCTLLGPAKAELAGLYGADQTLAHADVGAFAGGVSITPSLRCQRGRYWIRVPLAADGRVGSALDELGVRGGVELEGRLSRRVTLGLSGRLARRWRPGWPDAYQPVQDAAGEPTGALDGTGRYGYRTASGALRFTWRALPDLALWLGGSWTRTLSDRDPRFDPVLAPDHLTPFDHQRIDGALGASGRAGAYRHRTELGAGGVWYDVALARDEGTGFTHGAPGGAPPNPTLEALRLSVQHRSSVWLSGLATRLAVSAGYAFEDDLYQGYLTCDEVTGGLDARIRPWRRAVIHVGYDLAWRRYRATGYRQGPDHPPLDDGASRRTRLTHVLAADVEVQTVGRWPRPFASVRAEWSDTTYPDYLPWVFPRTSPYAIDFDWTRIVALGGIRLEL